MSKVLKMTFQLEGTKTLTYTLAEPKEALTRADVEAVMYTMIARKAVVSNGVSPTAIKAIVVKSTEEIALA